MAGLTTGFTWIDYIRCDAMHTLSRPFDCCSFMPQPVLSACGVQKACCSASNILLFECMTDESDKTPRFFEIPSSGLASAGFCFIWRGLKSRKTDCPSLYDDPVGQGSKTQPTAASSKTFVSCQPPVKMADSWNSGQVSNLVRLVLGNSIHSLILTLGTASPTTTTLTTTIPRTKSLHGPSVAHSLSNRRQFHTCFFPKR